MRVVIPRGTALLLADLLDQHLSDVLPAAGGGIAAGAMASLRSGARFNMCRFVSSPACMRAATAQPLTVAVHRRYEELRGAVCGSADGTTCEACPSCQQFYLGLAADAKTLRLEASAAPLEVFAVAKQRERDRDLQFIAQGAGRLPAHAHAGLVRLWTKCTLAAPGCA